MENTKRFNHNRVTLKMGELRGWGVNSNSDTNGYVVPLWIQEVSQILRSQNNQKTVLRSS